MNYGDNIYYVNETIKLLEHSLKMELNPNLTGDHLTEQLRFADRMLNDLYEESGSINGLAHYEDALRAIMKSKYRFTSFLTTLKGMSEHVRKRFSLDDEDLEAMGRKHDADMRYIEDHFTNKDNQKPPEDLVSQEEFRYLFGSDE